MPLISVCVIVYNLERYIGACLDSILKQDFNDYELILVDNGSSDNSISICENYALKYGNVIKYYKLPQPTLPARGHAFAATQATGQYVHLIDGDDCVASDYFSRVTEVIHKSRPDMIMGCFECIVEEGSSNYLDVKIDADQINSCDVHDAIEYIFKLPYFNRYVWRFIVRKHMLDYIMFDDSISHLVIVDNIKSTVWLMHAESIHFMETPIYLYRRRLGSTVSSINNRMTTDYLKGIIEISRIIFSEINANKLSYFLRLQSKQILWYLKLFYSGYTHLEVSDKLQIAHYIEDNKKIIHLLRSYKVEEVDNWITSIEIHGAYLGIELYWEKGEKLFLSNMNKHRDQPIFIYPAGKYAEATYNALSKVGIMPMAFLDNDTAKAEIKINNIPCKLPEWLNDCGFDIDSCIVVISTIYDEIERNLIERALSIGISKKNIIIR